MNKNKVQRRPYLWLVVVAMICIVLIMAVSGNNGFFGTPFGGSNDHHGGSGPTPTPTPSPYTGGVDTSTPTPESTPSPEPSTSPTPYPSPTPDDQQGGRLIITAESDREKNLEFKIHLVYITVTGPPNEECDVYAALGDDPYELLFSFTIPESGFYSSYQYMTSAGTWWFYAESETEASAEVMEEVA